MAHLTRQGALNVTTALDRIANLLASNADILGVPEKIASDMAYRCDLLSDHIEQHAVRLAGDEVPPADEKTEEAVDKKAAVVTAVDETGLSVEPAPGNDGFDANVIGDQVPGAVEALPPVESFMSGHFTQEKFFELGDKQQGGELGFQVSASIARLRKLASVSALSNNLTVLKALHAKLDISPIAAIKSMAAEVAKQIVAVSKVLDMHIEQLATSMASPEVLIAAQTILQVLSEELPALSNLVLDVDPNSPSSVLAATGAVSQIKELVVLSSAMVSDAAKSADGKAAKTAAAKTEELPAPPKSEEKSDKKAANSEEKEVVVEDTKAAAKKSASDFNLFV